MQTIKNYIKAECFKTRETPFLFSPLRFLSFSRQGETMVESALVVSKCFRSLFAKQIPETIQREIAMDAFKSFKNAIYQTGDAPAAGSKPI